MEKIKEQSQNNTAIPPKLAGLLSNILKYIETTEHDANNTKR